MSAMTVAEARELLSIARQAETVAPLTQHLLAHALQKLMSGGLQERATTKIRRARDPYRRFEIGLLSFLAPLFWLAMVWNWR